MNILLTCSECEYNEKGRSEKELINKIIMWNHVKKVHPRTADRIMRMYKIIPNNLLGVRSTYIR